MEGPARGGSVGAGCAGNPGPLEGAADRGHRARTHAGADGSARATVEQNRRRSRPAAGGAAAFPADFWINFTLGNALSRRGRVGRGDRLPPGGTGGPPPPRGHSPRPRGRPSENGPAGRVSRVPPGGRPPRPEQALVPARLRRRAPGEGAARRGDSPFSRTRSASIRVGQGALQPRPGLPGDGAIQRGTGSVPPRTRAGGEGPDLARAVGRVGDRL